LIKKHFIILVYAVCLIDSITKYYYIRLKFWHLKKIGALIQIIQFVQINILKVTTNYFCKVIFIRGYISFIITVSTLFDNIVMILIYHK